MATRVRPALFIDIEWLMEQLRSFDKFAAYGRSLIEDESHARLTMLGIIDKHMVFIAENNHKPVGFIAAYKTPHPFNPRIKVLSECFWWVAPEGRKTRAGALLLREFIAYGRRHCDWITMSLEDVSPVKPGSLSKLGFKLKESSFLMEV